MAATLKLKLTYHRLTIDKPQEHPLTTVFER